MTNVRAEIDRRTEEAMAAHRAPGGPFDCTIVTICAKPGPLGGLIFSTYFCDFASEVPSRPNVPDTLLGYREGVWQISGPKWILKHFVAHMPRDIRKRAYVPDGCEPFMNIKPLAPKRDWRKLFLR